MPIYDTLVFLNLLRIRMVATLRRPPQREIKPELIPDEKAAKPAFRMAIPNADKGPNAEQANITIIFEKPGFIPMGRGNAARSIFSVNDNARASAPIMPVIAR